MNGLWFRLQLTHTAVMRNRLAKVLLPLAGLAMVTMPGVLTPVVAPADSQCAGGLCEVCPAVAKALTAAGAEIYCIA